MKFLRFADLKVGLSFVFSLCLMSAAQSCGTSEMDVLEERNEIIFPMQKVGLSGSVWGTSFPTATESVFCISAFTSVDSFTDETLYFASESVDRLPNGSYTMKNRHFYPTGDEMLYFYAWSPCVGDFSFGDGTPVVRLQIDGNQDLMWAKNEDGYGQGHTEEPSLTFNHSLQQLRFTATSRGFGDSMYIESIKVHGMRSSVELNLKDGTVSFNGDADSVFEISGRWLIDDEGYMDVPAAIMMEPGVRFFKLDVSTTGGSFTADISIPEDSAAAGKAYLLSLTFSGNLLIPNVTVVPWVLGADVSQTLNPGSGISK